MTFDPTTLAGTPSHWLPMKIRYEGAARAEFANPPGVIEGPATVSFDSAGKSRVHLKIVRIEAPDEKTFALESGHAPAGQFLVNGVSNPCRSLTVTTKSGVYTGGDRILVHGATFFGRSEVELFPLHS